jgi:hypothetical protein
MRLGRRLGARHAALAGGVSALAIALLMLVLGHRSDRNVERLAAEGRLAQGGYSEAYDDEAITFTVDGTEYRTFFMSEDSADTPALFKPERVRTPRLGPEAPLQVVYLPSDPSVARMRDDMVRSGMAIYGTAGMFGLIGTLFTIVGIFAMRRPRS